MQQYVGTKYVEETGQGEDSGSTKPYDKEVCLAGCPLGLRWYIIIIQNVKYLFWSLQGEPEYNQQHCQVVQTKKIAWAEVPWIVWCITTYIAGSKLSCRDGKSSSTINCRNKVLLDRCELMKGEDLVPNEWCLAQSNLLLIWSLRRIVQECV